jgi:hypothetical protein
VSALAPQRTPQGRVKRAIRRRLGDETLLIVSLLLTIGGYSSVADAWTGTGATWTTLPLNYEINTNSSQELGAMSTVQVVQESYSAWTSPSCSGFRVNYTGATNESWNSRDRVNTHIWIYNANQRPAQLGGRETIGVTLSSFQGRSMVDGDILYNGIDHQWTTNPSRQGQVDAQSIITHETGHQLGLGHSPSSQATMYAAYLGGTGARSLATDDLNGVCSLYPSNVAPECTNDTECEGEESCIRGQCLVAMSGGEVGADCSIAPCDGDLICVQGGSGPFCTLICQGGDCPTGWGCIAVNTNEGQINLCLPSQGDATGQGEFGTACNGGPDCLSGLCVSDGMNAFCTETCVENSDCPDQGMCVALSNGGGACIPGGSGPTSGSGLPFGDPCGADYECSSTLCISDGQRSYCSQSCRQSEDCPEGAGCVSTSNGDGVCAIGQEDMPPTPSDGLPFGAPCEEADQCQSRLCVSDGTSNFCTASCQEDRNCPDDAECVALQGGGGACLPRDGSDDPEDEEDELGAIDDPCETSDECESGLCIGYEENAFWCAQPCVDDEDCGGSQYCEPIDDQGGLCEDLIGEQGGSSEPEDSTQPEVSGDEGEGASLVRDIETGCQSLHPTPLTPLKQPSILWLLLLGLTLKPRRTRPISQRV